MSLELRNGQDFPNSVKDFINGAGVLVIDGQEVGSHDGSTFQTVDPATEDVLASIPQAGVVDVDAAVRAAAEAHHDGRWRTVDTHRRAAILARIADLIERDAEMLAWVDVLDQGKPYAHALGEMVAAANCFRYFAGWVDKVYGNVFPSRPGRFVFSRREPVGVCAQIIPWNFPFLMAAWKVAPAVAFGNSVVLKPAEQTPLSAVWLLRLVREAGVPDGVVNLVQGVGDVTGAALVRHHDVDKVAFTGSTEVGKSIMREAASSLHKVTLELGGKSPNIVFPDAPGGLAKAAARASFACFYNAGEVCTAGTRLLVHSSVHAEVVERVKGAAEQIRVGPGWKKDSGMGPLVSHEQLDRVKGFVEGAQTEGAELITGGGTIDSYDSGYWFQPTIFDGVTASMQLAREEVFGPVLAVQSFDDEDEAIALANGVEYGLAAGVWTADIGRAHRVAEQVAAGTVWINTYGELDTTVSFGGYKQSGIGRELGPRAVDAYTQTKSVWVNIK